MLADQGKSANSSLRSSDSADMALSADLGRLRFSAVNGCQETLFSDFRGAVAGMENRSARTLAEA